MLACSHAGSCSTSQVSRLLGERIRFTQLGRDAGRQWGVGPGYTPPTGNRQDLRVPPYLPAQHPRGKAFQERIHCFGSEAPVVAGVVVNAKVKWGANKQHPIWAEGQKNLVEGFPEVFDVFKHAERQHSPDGAIGRFSTFATSSPRWPGGYRPGRTESAEQVHHDEVGSRYPELTGLEPEAGSKRRAPQSPSPLCDFTVTLLILYNRWTAEQISMRWIIM